MDMIKLFNVLLLTLSLATVLLTLISYVLYRIRQMPARGGQVVSGIKMQGAFFTRYLPSDMLDATAPAPRTAAPVSPFVRILRLYLPNNALAFFTIATVVIFVCLLVPQYLLGTGKSGATADKALSFNDYRKLGLLKSYEYEDKTVENVLKESIPDNEQKNLAAAALALQARKVYLFVSATNDKYNGGPAVDSLRAWREGLARMGVAFQEKKDLGGLQPTDLVILPQVKALTDSERTSIDQAWRAGTGFLATGPIGLLDGQGKPRVAGDDWSETHFGVKAVENPTPLDAKPTMFSAASDPLWNVPAGLMTNAFPSDPGYEALAVRGTTAAYSTDYQGQPLQVAGKTVARAQFLRDGAARAGWLAFDPSVKTEASLTATEFYVQEMFVASLGWTAKLPVARVSPWKDGKSTAVVVAIDSEDQFENVAGFFRVFKKLKYPATFFAVSELMQQKPEFAASFRDGFELASHSENHADFEGQPAEMQFDRIQTSRMELEEMAKTPVLGFRPPEEKFDEATINATLQNHLKYFSGNNRFYRFAPAWVAAGKLLYFPRVTLDDFYLRYHGDTKTADQIVVAMLHDFDRVRQAGGAYFFSGHTQIFGTPEYLAALEKALAQIDQADVWKTNYSELYAWSKDRAKVTVELTTDPAKAGARRLTIANHGGDSTAELAVQVDPGELGDPKDIVVKELTAGEGRSVAAGAQLGRGVLRVPGIAPGDSRVFELEKH